MQDLRLLVLWATDSLDRACRHIAAVNTSMELLQQPQAHPAGIDWGQSTIAQGQCISAVSDRLARLAKGGWQQYSFRLAPQEYLIMVSCHSRTLL